MQLITVPHLLLFPSIPLTGTQIYFQALGVSGAHLLTPKSWSKPMRPMTSNDSRCAHARSLKHSSRQAPHTCACTVQDHYGSQIPYKCQRAL